MQLFFVEDFNLINYYYCFTFYFIFNTRTTTYIKILEIPADQKLNPADFKVNFLFASQSNEIRNDGLYFYLLLLMDYTSDILKLL